MTKRIVKLDKAKIRKAIAEGNNAYGQRWLAVQDGDYQIHWADNNRPWNPWSDDAQVIGIPALNPEGSGRASEDAEDMLKSLNLHSQAQALIEAQDIGWVEAAERLAPADWDANRSETLDWLAEAFLAACNGDGTELQDHAPWGYSGDVMGNDLEILDPPARFEWMESPQAK